MFERSLLSMPPTGVVLAYTATSAVRSPTGPVDLVTFEADSVDEAERAVAGDPFVREELLESSVVKQWVPE